VALAQEHDAALVTGGPKLRALGKAITLEWLGTP
jgi:hypothetical protein